MNKNLIIYGFLFSSVFSIGQSLTTPLNRDLSWQIEKQLRLEPNNKMLVKPYLYSKITDTTQTFSKDSTEWSLKNNTINSNLFEYQKGDLYFNINPDIDATVTAPSYFQTEYGIRFNSIYKNLSLSVKLNQGLGAYPTHVDSIAQNYNVIPGKGYAMPLGSNYRYNDNQFVLSYNLNKVFNFQLGQAKHFWGNGYRSFYLSDNSRSMPYFKITADIWHIKYTAMWAKQKNLLSSNAQGFQNLHGVFNHFGWNVSKKLNVGIFQTVTWSQFDTLPNGDAINRGWDLQYANPFIFFRPVEYSLGSPDNVIVGADAKFELNKKNQLYFQLALDELIVSNIRADVQKFLGLNYDSTIVNWWGNKYALQLGWKSYDVLNIEGLDFQQELNTARPYIYSHTKNGQGYTNFNQALAHPLGSNFRESVTFIRYQKKKLMVELKLIFAAYGADSTAISYGGNVLKSYLDVANVNAPVRQYGVQTLQGLRTNLAYQDVRLVYFINPKSNLRAEALISHRNQSSEFNNSDNWFFSIGIKTTLGNFNTDF